jgi:hypothetical protein
VIYVVRSQADSVQDYRIEARPIQYSNQSKRSFLLERSGNIHFTVDNRKATSSILQFHQRSKSAHATEYLVIKGTFTLKILGSKHQCAGGAPAVHHQVLTAFDACPPSDRKIRRR